MKNITAANERIQKLVARRRQLQNMMTCRVVRYELEENIKELALISGLDVRTAYCIWDR